MVQLAPAARMAGLAGQVFVWAKLPGLVPPRLMPAIARGAVPLLVRVTACAALVLPTACPAKVKLVGLSVTAGAVPVPPRAMVCGLPVALSAMLRLAARLPLAVGLKVTL